MKSISLFCSSFPSIFEVHLNSLTDRLTGVKPTKKKKPSQISGKKHNDTTVHEEKKFVKCDICDFSSELNIDLKNHMSSIHGGIKQFICVICEGSFEQKIKLQTHIESVHGKKVSLVSL